MPIGGTAFFGMNQHPRITSTYLNQASRRGDPAPGVPVSTAQASGSIIQPYYGQVGGKLTITDPWAAQFADPSVGPLYGGILQYVRLSATDTVNLVRGQVLFWLDELNYVVTAANTAPGGKVAGVALCPTSPGNWDFIQIAGIAMANFGGTVAVGGLAGAAAATPSNAVTATVVDKNYLGIAVMTAGASGVVSPLELNLGSGYNF